MRRTLSILLAAALLAGLTLPSCSKPRAAEVAEGPRVTGGSDEAPGSVQGPAAPADVAEAVVLSDGAPFCELAGGTVSVKERLALGEEVKRVSEAVEKARPLEGGAEGDYRRYRLESGEEGWIEARLLGQGRLMVVTVERSPTYTEARTSKPTGAFLPALALVAAHAEGVGGGFVYFSQVGRDGAVQKGFLKDDEVSTKQADLAVALLFARAAADPAKTRGYYEEARKNWSGSTFDAKIEGALAALGGGKEGGPAEEKSIGSGTCLEDNVNVRDSPDAVFGAVVGTLSKGDRVEILARGTEELTVEGQTGRWVRIAKPAGWVFGARLKIGD